MHRKWTGENACRALPYELDFDTLWNQSGFVTQIEEFLRSFRYDVAAIDRVVIHVHTDELVRHAGVHVSGELQGVRQGFFSMIERVLDALSHQPAALSLHIAWERAEQGIGAQRQGQIKF
jgi:hypothetical protein